MSTLIFIDSFDHWGTSPNQAFRKWTADNGAGVGGIVAGRTGLGYRCGALSGLFYTFGPYYKTLTMGVAYTTEAHSNIPIRLYGPGVRADLSFGGEGGGKLRFDVAYPGGSGLSDHSVYVFNINEWYYIEMQAAIVDGAPPHLIMSARVNGEEFLTWDHTATSGLNGTQFGSVTFFGPGGGLGAIWDDLYVTDTEFLGDCRISVLYPNAAGDSAAWIPVGAAANWQTVKEHPADDNTTYVATPTIDAKDLYNLDNIDPAFVGLIKGVQALWCVKKSDEGEGAVKGLWKSGATEITQDRGHNFFVTNGYHPSATSYLYNIQTERKSLFTGTDWTKTEIDNLQLGITRTL